MVDLPIGRAMALVVAALLAGSAASHQVVPAAPPQSGSAMREAMSDAIKAGDRNALTNAAVMLAMMGGGMSDRSFDSFATLLDPDVLHASRAPQLDQAGDPVEALRRWFHANSAVHDYGAPTPATEVPADFRLVEGIAFDPVGKRLFACTVIDGRLVYVDREGWHEIPVGFPRSGLFGMAIDPKRRLLWVATGAVEETAVRSDPMSGVIAVDLDSLKVVRRIRVQARKPGVVGDVTVGPDGTVYASNSESGAIHVYRPGAAGMADLVPPGLFKSPQGMAVSQDGRHLFVADYHSGLWAIRLRDRRATQVTTYGPAMLDGIDGLVRLPDSNILVATQNGTSPRRIIELTVSPDGARVERLVRQYIVPADARDPTLATLQGFDLLFVGDGQWEHYGPGGKPRDDKAARPTSILRMSTAEMILTSP